MANEVVLNTIFQIKRGTKERWEELNPVLKAGEPGFVLDTNLLKVGDGKTPWNDLDYLEGSNEVITVYKAENLPAVGNPLLLYRVIADKGLYQYDESSGKYILLNPNCEGVKTIKAAGQKLDVDETGSVNIPAAMKNTAGLLKGDDEFVIEQGVVKQVSTDLLTAGDDVIVFNCGGIN